MSCSMSQTPQDSLSPLLLSPQALNKLSQAFYLPFSSCYHTARPSTLSCLYYYLPAYLPPMALRAFCFSHLTCTHAHTLHTCPSFYTHGRCTLFFSAFSHSHFPFTFCLHTPGSLPFCIFFFPYSRACALTRQNLLLRARGALSCLLRYTPDSRGDAYALVCGSRGFGRVSANSLGWISLSTHGSPARWGGTCLDAFL